MSKPGASSPRVSPNRRLCALVILFLASLPFACSSPSSISGPVCDAPCAEGQTCGPDGLCHPATFQDGGTDGPLDIQTSSELGDLTRDALVDLAGPSADRGSDSAPGDSARPRDVSRDSARDAARDLVADAASDTGSLGPFVVYLSTKGRDSNSGLTPATSVLTLARVQTLLKAARPPRDVEVRIAQGTYLGQSVTWTYYNPAHRISFMPIDYHGGGVTSIAGLPIFDGQGAGALLGLHVADGKPTRLEFIYLQIQRYQKFGILFGGNRDDFTQGWNGYNRVYGCRFTKIGSYDNPGANGYGALDLVNSRHNTIRNNHFVDVRNASSGAGLMHAVYLAHGSSDNAISANRFTNVSGDPIRVRDESNRNIVTDNVFSDTGAAFISDWWCDKSKLSACTKASGECPSWENQFRKNQIHCGYGGKTAALFKYYQGVSYVPAWCVNHATKDGWRRLYTSSNTGSCP